MTPEPLSWDEFMRVDMRVGRIVEVEDFPEARLPYEAVSVVREEFGPTLPELLGSRLGVPVRKVWLALAAIGIVAAAIVLWLALRTPPGQNAVVVRRPVAFNLIYTDALERRAPARCCSCSRARGRRSRSPCGR